MRVGYTIYTFNKKVHDNMQCISNETRNIKIIHNYLATIVDAALLVTVLLKKATKISMPSTSTPRRNTRSVPTGALFVWMRNSRSIKYWLMSGEDWDTEVAQDIKQVLFQYMLLIGKMTTSLKD